MSDRPTTARRCVVAPLLALVVLTLLDVQAAVAGAPESFCCVAHDAAHSGIADGAGPPMLGAPRFVAVAAGLELVGPCTPVVADLTIYVCADAFDDEQAYAGSCVLAFDELDGSLVWSRPIEPRAMDSWSSPSVFLGEVEGERVACVVVGSGNRVQAFDARTGTPLWSTPLAHNIVNASPLVAGGRVFITDYTGFGPGGRLYALDVRDGAVVWSREIGQTNGNTPAYADGAVYVATSDGWVRSLDAADGSPNWENDFFAGWTEGFAGGLNVRGGALYAATYGFYGTRDNSTLLKLDAETGGVIWSAPAERTDSIPVVVDDRIYLAGGVAGFGSRRTLECFGEPDGALLWSYDAAGGWLHQPCYADGLLYTGLIPAAGYAFGPASDLHILDVSKASGEPGFVIDVYGACGSSPSAANGNVYSIGTSGGDAALYAFGRRLDPWIDDVAWDQVAKSVVVGFRCIGGAEYLVERADADAYADGLTWYSLPGDAITADTRYETVTDDLTANPLTHAFRFYRVKRADGLSTSRQTVGVFELPINAAATTLYFAGTPLLPDPDHNSVADVFGEGAARQIVRTNFTVSDLDENSGAISRMRNATGTYAVLAGSAFAVEPGVGYEVYLGTGFQTQFTLRLVGYVPEEPLTLPLTKRNAQAIRWMGYSMPRAIKLSELGLVEAVTPSWNSSNKVRLLAPGSSGWGNYTYSTMTQMWSPFDPDLVPGMGIVFIRQGFNNLTDELVLPKWYLYPPNVW